MQRNFTYKVLAIIAGVVVIGISSAHNHHVSHLKKYGTPATVIPPESYIDHSKNGSHTYTADIQFKTAEGGTVTGNHSMPSDVLDALKANQPVTVLYDPREPSEFVFQSESTDYAIPGFGVLMIIGALIFL